jgi:hypothetical protein
MAGFRPISSLLWRPQYLETRRLLALGGNAGQCQHLYRSGLVKNSESTMAGLSVRKLDDEMLSRLRIRAAKHGVSM